MSDGYIRNGSHTAGNFSRVPPGRIDGGLSITPESEWFDEPESPLPTEAVVLLLEGVAPERGREFAGLFGQHAPGFFVHKLARSYGGFCAFEDKNEILMAPGCREALWLFCFAAWRAFKARVPQEFLAWLLPGGQARDQLLLAEDEGQQVETLAAHDYTALAKQVMAGTVPTGTAWPTGIPTILQVMAAAERKDPLWVEPIAIKDMALFALAYVLLHECRHVMFNADRRGIPQKDEELECDRFAVDMILSGAKQWARSQAEPPQDPERVAMKRSMGLLVGFFVFHTLTDPQVRAGSRKYPALSERLRIVVDAIDLPEEDNFWLFGSCLLRELHQDSADAVLGVDSTQSPRQNFLSLAGREFR